MPNFATAFKDEITRIARKELRKSTDPLRKQLATQRRDIAALKRERDQLKRALAQLNKNVRQSKDVHSEAETDAGTRTRFSASGLRSLRHRLGLSAEDMARLGGVSAQSIYNWEHGKSRPRQAQLERIAALRRLGKRQANQLLTQDTTRQRR